MRDAAVTLITAMAILIIGAIIIVAARQSVVDRCEDAWARMYSMKQCADTPGCFYDAEAWYMAKLAYEYYERKDCRDLTNRQ